MRSISCGAFRLFGWTAAFVIRPGGFAGTLDGTLDLCGGCKAYFVPIKMGGRFQVACGCGVVVCWRGTACVARGCGGLVCGTGGWKNYILLDFGLVQNVS